MERVTVFTGQQVSYNLVNILIYSLQAAFTSFEFSTLSQLSFDKFSISNAIVCSLMVRVFTYTLRPQRFG